MTIFRASIERRAGLAAAVLLCGLCFPVAATQATSFEDIVGELELHLDDQSSSPRSADERQELLALRQFYEGREFQPAWLDGTGVTEQGGLLIQILSDTSADGLLPENYAVEQIEGGRDSATGAESLAALDFMMSRSLVHYGRDISAGRVQPNKVDSEVFIYPDPVKSLDLLSEAASTSDLERFLAELAPQSTNYKRLKWSLAEHRALAARGGWSRLPEGETLKPEMRDPQVALLRQRLRESGDLEGESDDPDLFDPDLEAAVKRFQARHGLDVDGAVGKMTRAALNVPVEARIDQMLLNMERRRWMPDDLGERYIFVNLADFELKLVDGLKTVFDTRVVVGKPYHRTPVFSGEMTYLVINPYWHVPPSIARNEILPAVQKDVGYLAQKNFTVLSDWSGSASKLDPLGIDWGGISKASLSYKFRQDPGDGNALGRIKFMFPNQFNVYLHDTPARSLFSRTVRSFSHGCIRVQDPPGLAAVVLDGSDGWSQEKILSAIDSKQRKIVRLEAALPVHLTYLTAWVNKDGSVHFRDDIYGRDERLQKALARANVTGDLGR
ncbi:MAG: L,D-transpeptidase family protein [Kiloniellales bacterium]|nr:L,D-transpeptidase family protein [Kiloniellales bacterium]